MLYRQRFRLFDGMDVVFAKKQIHLINKKVTLSCMDFCKFGDFSSFEQRTALLPPLRCRHGWWIPLPGRVRRWMEWWRRCRVAYGNGSPLRGCSWTRETWPRRHCSWRNLYSGASERSPDLSAGTKIHMNNRKKFARNFEKVFFKNWFQIILYNRLTYIINSIANGKIFVATNSQLTTIFLH